MFDSEVLEPVFETPPESYDQLDLSNTEWALLDLPVEVGRPGIPEGLEDLEPGRALGAVLSTIDVDSVSGVARVSVLRAHQRQASHYEAVVDSDMAAISDDMVGDMVEPGDALFPVRSSPLSKNTDGPAPPSKAAITS